MAKSVITSPHRAEYRTIWRKICYCVAGLAFVAVMGCGGGGDASGGGDVTGPGGGPVNLLFNLQMVNGQTLPATFQPVDGKLVISSGTMLLRTDKTFAENIYYTFTPTGGAAAADTAISVGTYAQTGTDVVFTIPPGGTDPQVSFNGTISGSTLSYNDAGFVAVYQR